MYDDDRDALAAEYVLGTLSAEEREQAEALLAVDSGFAETVRLWEHRLGELNVMVEAVEPPTDLWERIKSGVDGAERRVEAPSKPDTTEEELRPLDATASPAVQAVPEAMPEQSFEPADDLLAHRTEEAGEAANGSSLASVLLAQPAGVELDNRLQRSSAAAVPPMPVDVEQDASERNLKRWRGLAIAASAIAAVLAIYVALAHFAPGLLPVERQSQAMLAATKHPAASQLVAVLQQEPTPPAFLVMLDPQERTITVRRLTTAPDSGRSYELWLNSAKLQKPVSLGLIGTDEFTNPAVPTNVDVETMRAANYSVSLEPAGGSTVGAPSGPMLFRGRMIEAFPGASE
jgi:anti-sigma-K factor RskA